MFWLPGRFLGLPLCLCTDCVFKVGRVSITSVSCLLWGLSGAAHAVVCRLRVEGVFWLPGRFLGLPLCLCTDCVFKVGRVSITSVICFLWGLELPTISLVGCVLKACFGRLVWFLGLPLCLCTDCVFSFISYNRINHFSTTGLLRCDD